MFFSRLLPMKTSSLSLRAKICNLIYETIEGHFTYWWVLLINTSLFDEHKETINTLRIWAISPKWKTLVETLLNKINKLWGINKIILSKNNIDC